MANFDFGKMTAGLGMLGSTVNAYTSMTNSLPNNTYQDEIDALNSTQIDANSFNELQNQFRNINLAKTNYSYSDLDPMSAGQVAGNIIGSGVNGALEGLAAFGPWGLFKGVADMAVAGAGYGVRRSKVKKQIDQLESNAKIANQNIIDKIQNSAMNIGKNQTNNYLLNTFANGGKIQDHFSNGVRTIEEGGSHEQNPYGGVLQGIASDGLPNLVEEGEVVYNDYVYSKRLNVPNSDKEILGLKKKKTYSYAEAAEEIQKESKERANDPLSKQNLDVMLGRLQESQENYKVKREQNRLRKAYNEMTPDEQASLLSMAMDTNQAQQTLPQQQMAQPFAVGGHLFPIGSLTSVPKTAPSNYIGPEWLNLSDLGKREAWENYLNNVTDEVDAAEADRLNELYEKVPQINTDNEYKRILGFNPFNQNDTTTQNDTNDSGIKLPNTNTSDALKMMSVAGTVGNAIKSLFDTSNYSNINRAERAIASVPPISPSPIGERIAYRPIDQNYLVNQYINTALGNRRLAAENSLGNIGLIRNLNAANNYNLATGLGQIYLQGKQYNDKSLNDVMNFNRGTSQFNSTQSFDADKVNQALALNKAQSLFETGKAKDTEKQLLQGTQGTNITAALQALSGLSDDVWNRAMHQWMAENGYYEWLNDKKKNGGKLNTKKGGKHA